MEEDIMREQALSFNPDEAESDQKYSFHEALIAVGGFGKLSQRS